MALIRNASVMDYQNKAKTKKPILQTFSQQTGQHQLGKGQTKNDSPELALRFI